MKKGLVIFCVAVILVGATGAVVWNGELRSIASVKMVDGNNYLYSMDYVAPYDLDEVIGSDLDSNQKLLSYVVKHLTKGLPITLSTPIDSKKIPQSEQPEQNGPSGQPEQNGQSEQSGQNKPPGQPEQNGQSEQSGQNKPPEQPEQNGPPEQPEQNGPSGQPAQGLASPNCTSFQAGKVDGSGFWFGRNYDFFKNPTLVVSSRPHDGFASLSVCDMSHFGYSLERLPGSFKERILCLAAIYAPMDGINEKGLCISIMALPKQAARQESGKHKVGTSILMRLILDRCATVEEALALLETVDVVHDQAVGGGYHYLVADAGGDCAVIEFDLFDGWKTLITRKLDGQQFLHVTNHLVHPKYYTEEPDPVLGNPHSRSWWRYANVARYLSSLNGALTLDQAQECLANVHWENLLWDNGMVEDTQYSNVYDQSSPTLYLRNWNDYPTTYTFPLSLSKR